MVRKSEGLVNLPDNNDFYDRTDKRLYRALAEQLKVPLTQIARQTELTSGDRVRVLSSIGDAATTMLRLIDSYLLSSELAQTHLLLEPVSVSAALQSTAEALEPAARAYGCDLEVELGGRYCPVMAHEPAARAALFSLGQVFIEAAGNETDGRSVVTLAAHRTAGGVTAGVFSNRQGLNRELFRRGRTLLGRTRQPMSDFTSGSAAGVFVAETLFRSMAVPLKVASYQRACGLAATFMPSRQLNLV